MIKYSLNQSYLLGKSIQFNWGLFFSDLNKIKSNIQLRMLLMTGFKEINGTNVL
ncbi:hypothetical protein NSA50_09685 [Clostridium sp. DSM 100503]|uniref:hypothetical protein n=1 Tax=Clostridium sp. DSM 100503 TaxID=2963282 RepID=UPI00214A1E22|nr:hypothetical protein [Clostridium sp. DSM 100503]MCR1951320.1 hypothetical protein [Clostridium sp. DSM 100503]